MNLDALLASLRSDEGLRLKPYLDTATPPRVTIGYGHNLTDNRITKQQAEDWLVADTIAAQRNAAILIPGWLGLSDVRQNVLSNMAFNLGPIGIAKFHNMIVAVNEGRFADAAAEMRDSAWFHQVGGRAKRLALEMETGVVV